MIYVKAICILCCVAAAYGQGGFSPDVLALMGKLSSTLQDLAAKQNISSNEVPNKTLLTLLQATSKQINDLAKTVYQQPMSTSLLTLLSQKSLKELVQYYNGFNNIPNMQQYNASISMLLAMTIQLDSAASTSNTLKSLIMVTGNTSLAPLLNTTSAALMQRRYLTDVYPLLLRTLPWILDKTKMAFLTNNAMMTPQMAKLLPRSAMAALLGIRQKMAFAIVKSNTAEIVSLSKNMSTVIMKALSPLNNLQKLSEIQNMPLAQATTKCNISLPKLKSKSILQIMLICINLPENYPILDMIPQHGIPVAAFKTNLTDIAKTLSMSVDVLLTNSMTEVMRLYVTATGFRGQYFVIPIFYAARAARINTADILEYTVADLASRISGKSTADIYKKFNLTSADKTLLEKTKFKDLPNQVKQISGVHFSVEHFYFIPMYSLIVALTNRNLPPSERGRLLSVFAVPVDAASIMSIAKIFKLTPDQLKKKPISEVLMLMTGMTSINMTKVLANKTMLMNRVSLQDLQDFNSMFGKQSKPLILSPTEIQHYIKMPILRILFSPLKNIVTGDMKRTSSIQTMFRKMPNGSYYLSSLMKKFGVSREVVSEMRFNQLMTKSKMKETDFWNMSLFSLFKMFSKPTNKTLDISKFMETPLIRTLSSCRIKPNQLPEFSIQKLLLKCFPTQSQTMVVPEKISKLVKMPIDDLRKLQSYGSAFLQMKPISFLNEATYNKLRPLLVPMTTLLKEYKMTMEQGLKLSFVKLLNGSMLSSDNFFAFFQKSGIYGPGLDFLKKISVADLRNVLSIKEAEFAKLSLYDAIKKASELFVKGKSNCAQLSRYANLCKRNSRCVGIPNSYKCRCKDGLAGDGVNCYDACAKKRCPAETLCSNIPDAGAVCRCKNRDTVMKNGKCKRVKGFMIQVKKVKFNQEYKKEYADVNSVVFKNKAAEIEDALFRTVCQKLKCVAVVVTSITRGSIVVDFNLVFDSNNVTAAQAQAATAVALKSPEMAAFDPEPSSQPQAANTDACKSGIASCGSNQFCKTTSDGSYKCESKPMTGLGLGAIIGIVVAFCILLVVIIVVVYVKRKRSKQSGQYGAVYDKATDDKIQLT